MVLLFVEGTTLCGMALIFQCEDSLFILILFLIQVVVGLYVVYYVYSHEVEVEQ